MGDRAVDIGGGVAQSVVVAGDGNQVSLRFGADGPVLPLERKQFPPPRRRPMRELDVLLPDAGLWPLVGRADLLDELIAWLDGKEDISVHAVIAPAGRGKTRLAVELCGRVDPGAAATGQWLAGFIRPADLHPLVEVLATQPFAWQRNTLLVVDYAAQAQADLARWLDRLADQTLTVRLRILLLDRQAPAEFGWWRELTDPVMGSSNRRRDLFHADRPRVLSDLPEPAQRHALLRAACGAAAKLRGVPPPVLPDGQPAFDAALARAQFGNPLNLAMAGLIALDLGADGALSLRRLDAARRLGERELRRMVALGLAAGIEAEATRHVMGFNGLTGGLPVEGLLDCLRAELTAAGRVADQAGGLASLLEQEFPPRERTEEPARPRHMATVEPDLIGEAMVIEAFAGEPWRDQQAEARMACFSFIEGWYNPVRLHSALGYRSPMAYEAAQEQVIAEPK